MHKNQWVLHKILYSFCANPPQNPCVSANLALALVLGK
jgi:hypothetical protein